MYIPEAFREERPEVLHAFIERHPLGAMICTTADGLTANHIPMILTVGGDSTPVLRGHVVMREGEILGPPRGEPLRFAL